MEKFANVRKILVVVIAITLVISVLAWFISPSLEATLRLCLTGGLCWFLYQRKNWARWVMGVLFAIAAIYAWYIILMIPLHVGKVVVLVVMAGFYSVAAIWLLFSKPLVGYFKSEGGKSFDS